MAEQVHPDVRRIVALGVETLIEAVNIVKFKPELAEAIEVVRRAGLVKAKQHG